MGSMKKKIAMISIDYFVNMALREQLRDAFQDQVEVVSILLNEEKIIDTQSLDLIVCTTEPLIKEIEKKSTKKVPIIAIRRTVDLKKIPEVMGINTGERVLLVNNHIYTANETIEALEKLGVDHIEYIPYYPGCKEPIEEIAVTPGGTHIVPTGVKKIIDIGVRIIDISSIIEIFITLNLPMDKLSILSEKYSKEMIRSNKHTIEVNKILKGIFQVTNDGIAALDVSGNIFFSNKKLSDILGQEDDNLLSKNIVEIIKDRTIIDKILSLETIDHEIIEIEEKEFMLNKTLLYQGNIFKGYVLVFQETQQIQKLEKEVRKKIVSKGFVAKYTFNDLVGVSTKLQEKIQIAKKIAKSDLTVLIQGEDGTGKEIFAQAIHNNSRRKQEPFVAVNFAAISENLLESELFGYEEGAFTGASKGGKIGLFEQAHKGTIFIDEIGDTSPQIQTRLLRVLQEKQIMRVGGSGIIPIDVRVIAATNKDLVELIEKKAFRKDLYYRLKVLYFHIPKLRERKEDIPLLAKYFLKHLGSKKYFDKEVERIFQEYAWPGNIRELENLMYYIDSIVEGEYVTLKDLPEDFMDGIGEGDLIKGDVLHNEAYKILSSEKMKEYKILLEILQNVKHLDVKLGRNKMTYLLNNQGIYLSSQQVRSRLKDLEKAHFVEIGRTKQGTKITSLGEMFLEQKED